ncbi:hypothetical protein C121_98 [Stenotrophomonas phage C121]|uniref:hypothetical protein n=1 Tax=Stenotrophomonas phage C121 TaxID=2914029 RepID=UPI0023298CF3|nr:hypothetical protein PP752_gp98 [Stenotrophomonas phage C121]UKL14831.1 hypothetical protein C121_98 [Stenotrophomonas phage C121]
MNEQARLKAEYREEAAKSNGLWLDQRYETDPEKKAIAVRTYEIHTEMINRLSYLILRNIRRGLD